MSVLAMILGGLLAAGQAAPPALLVNGDFETPQTRPTPDGWLNAGTTGAGYRVETIHERPYAGGSAVRLSRDAAVAPSDRMTGVLSQPVNVVALRGHKVRLTAALRASGAPALLALQVQGPDGKPTFPGTGNRRPIVAKAWTVYTIEAEIDPAALLLVVSLNQPGEGAVDMDAATLEDLGPVDPAPEAQARVYLDTVLGLLQARHINGAEADWPALRAKAYAQTASAATPAQTYPAIWTVIRALGERHTFLMTPAAKKVIATRRPTDPLPTGEIQGDIGVVRLTGLTQDPDNPKDDGSTYQQAIEAVIQDGDARNVCGWVVDLTAHTGGNMYPGIQGLAPLLGAGSPGTFVSRLGRTPWTRTMKASTRTVRRPDAPIAVILGPRTASAGEAIAIGLIGRPDTRTFGQPTAGLTTGNATFPLSDGARLVLTGSYEEDRLGRRYTGAITPDETVDLDGAEAAARAWLAGRGCGRTAL